MIVTLVIALAMLFFLALIAAGVFRITRRLDTVIQLLENDPAAPKASEGKPQFQHTPTHELDARR